MVTKYGGVLKLKNSHVVFSKIIDDFVDYRLYDYLLLIKNDLVKL